MERKRDWERGRKREKERYIRVREKGEETLKTAVSDGNIIPTRGSGKKVVICSH
jgi:hypothetical protein